MSANALPPLHRDPDVGLRLRLVDPDGSPSLDGGWWPYSRDLVGELVALVRDFPRDRGRITRVVVCRTDWDTAPTRVDLGTYVLKIGAGADDVTHVIELETAEGGSLTLLVVPPRYTEDQGAEALLAASTPGNAHSGVEVLREVTDNHDADPADRWTRSEDGTPYLAGQPA